MRAPPGKTLQDAGICGWVAYSIAPEIAIGGFVRLIAKERVKYFVRLPEGSGSSIDNVWKSHFEGANEAMIGMVVATVP